MAKGLAIAGLVISTLALVVPLISLYIVWISLLLLTGAAAAGEKQLSIGAYIICAVNVLLLSPNVLMAFGLEEMQGRVGLRLGTCVAFTLPLLGYLISYLRGRRAGSGHTPV